MKYRVLLMLLLAVIAFGQLPTGADLLVIHTSFLTGSEFDEFAEWKTKKGVLTKVVLVTDVATTIPELRAYIESTQEWEPAPQFVLIASSVDNIPMILTSGVRSDYAYESFSGSGYRDIYVGRLPTSNNDELRVMLAKILSYERDPLPGAWLGQGVTIVREDSQEGHWEPGDEHYDPDDSIYHANTDTLEANMMRAGYTSVNRFYRAAGNNRDDVHAAVNAGCGFLSFRGQGVTNWWNPFACQPETALSNGFMLPFVYSGTCATIKSQSGTSTMAGCWWMRAGTPEAPAGGVGFFGSTSNITGSADLRGSILEGLAPQYFDDTTNSLAHAVEAGRRAVYDDWDRFDQYVTHVLLGDPEMDIRTRVPSNFTVTHPEEAFLGVSNTFNVNVGVPDAKVCIKLEENVYMRAFSNSSGIASFTFTPTVSGEMSVVATKKNYRPYEGICNVIPSGPFPNFVSSTFDDVVGGNGDGMLNPGEAIDMFISLRNDGTMAASGVSATLSTADPYITITTATASFPNIPVGATRQSSTAFRFTVSPTVPRGHSVVFNLHVTDGASRSWDMVLPSYNVHQPNFEYVAHNLNDSPPFGNGNNQLESGETARLVVTLLNNGTASLGMTEIQAVPIDDCIHFDMAYTYQIEWTASSSKNLDDSPFQISMTPFMRPSDVAAIRLLIEGDGLTYTYYDTIDFEIDLFGSVTYTGPDEYGYYCYDDTDVTTGQAPVYSWTDISSIGTRATPVTDLDDAIQSYYIPFTYGFYGEATNQISICSNGFITAGVETWSGGGAAGHERPIPSTGEANALMAGFWCDLNPHPTLGAGDIYAYNNSSNNTYMVQFNAVAHFGATHLLETFQIIIHNPAHWYSPTGDADIIFLYHTVADASGNTVGIENWSGTDGIQYVHRSSYDVNAEPIQAGRAIRFTTNPPTGTRPWIVIDNWSIADLPPDGNGNSYAEEGEAITLYITLRNQGTVTALNTQATLTSSDPFITIVDGNSNFGRINVGSTVVNTSDILKFSVSGLTENTHATFTLNISANGGAYTQNTAVYIPVWFGLGVEEALIPKSMTIVSQYPNPFNSVAHFDVQTEEAGNITLSIFDISGKKVRTIDGFYNAGRHSFEVDFDDASSGVYIYNIIAEGVTHTGRMVLMK